MKKVLTVSKTIIVCVFKLEKLFYMNDIKKIKKTLHSQSSPFCVVKISFFSYDGSLLGSFPLNQSYYNIIVKS